MRKKLIFLVLLPMSMFFMFVSCLYYYRNNEVRVDLQKKTDENVGFNIIGGNKYGIFVDSVEPWTPADKCNIPKFQKLLEVHFFLIIITFFCIITWTFIYYEPTVISLPFFGFFHSFNKKELIFKNNHEIKNEVPRRYCVACYRLQNEPEVNGINQSSMLS